MAVKTKVQHVCKRLYVILAINMNENEMPLKFLPSNFKVKHCIMASLLNGEALSPIIFSSKILPSSGQSITMSVTKNYRSSYVLKTIL